MVLLNELSELVGVRTKLFQKATVFLTDEAPEQSLVKSRATRAHQYFPNLRSYFNCCCLRSRQEQSVCIAFVLQQVAVTTHQTFRHIFTQIQPFVQSLNDCSESLHNWRTHGLRHDVLQNVARLLNELQQSFKRSNRKSWAFLHGPRVKLCNDFDGMYFVFSLSSSAAMLLNHFAPLAKHLLDCCAASRQFEKEGCYKTSDFNVARHLINMD